MKKAALAVLAAISTFSPIGRAAAEELTICEREMRAAAAEFGIPLGVLYAVGMTESGGKKGLQPLAMNIAGKPYVASSLTDALARFQKERSRGVKLIDLGCMQINQHYHGERFASVAEMFDPHKNVQYAARFLNELRARHDTWTMAVARYHAGPNNNPAQKQYVCLVIGNMVRSGFGAWTANSAAFCGKKAG
ncbi:transglycosylase SLT domain-containing protein [Pleomorphomonas sp. PLEO]|uniref:transglycosylase SLT domain-containing protein n=1 Tax=Pleomorphomonas sp. PLEO TaxID=3239306 RepID=UPI00351EC57C